ncbi:D-aspartate oxidase-like [Lingula anatina]|uniref:D-aspartate oxidase-like n=1 Tax=Lingula anatina TaxID=7574 RepID=A0A1S3HA44_LINAN|nr:D-aspartate oxidase-like [Lingula anatina]|eukprot:XP_013382965.1 D-aspartate oxidase-like [Lingula anatina]
MANIAVIGAGVVGLSTAVNIIESVPDARVTIYADRWSPDTVSDGAAGCFGPKLGGPMYPMGIELERFKTWGRDSFRHYDAVAHSADSSEAGVFVLSGYELYSKPENVSPYNATELMYNYRELTKEEMKRFPPKYKVGYFVTTLMAECQRYLPWLLKRFKSKGGHVVQQRVKTLQQFCGPYDLVVNCTGIGARELLGDTVLKPMRGQVMRVKAPWIRHYYFTDSDCYIYPGQDAVVLGGVKQYNENSLEVNEKDKATILKNCLEMVPSLKDAEFKYDWVGLRPSRKPVRVELEEMKFGDDILKVVHNYGHGASGIGLSWGTAVEATQIVMKALRKFPASKL